MKFGKPSLKYEPLADNSPVTIFTGGYFMKHIAIQKDLTPVKEYLEEKGYDVREFEGNAENALNEYGEVDAIVVTGLDNNVMGMEDTSCRTSIICADGKEPQEIESEICHWDQHQSDKKW